MKNRGVRIEWVLAGGALLAFLGFSLLRPSGSSPAQLSRLATVEEGSPLARRWGTYAFRTLQKGDTVSELETIWAKDAQGAKIRTAYGQTIHLPSGSIIVLKRPFNDRFFSLGGEQPPAFVKVAGSPFQSQEATPREATEPSPEPSSRGETGEATPQNEKETRPAQSQAIYPEASSIFFLVDRKESQIRFQWPAALAVSTLVVNGTQYPVPAGQQFSGSVTLRDQPSQWTWELLNAQGVRIAGPFSFSVRALSKAELDAEIAKAGLTQTFYIQ
jgi:hypothetical protein